MKSLCSSQLVSAAFTFIPHYGRILTTRMQTACVSVVLEVLDLLIWIFFAVLMGVWWIVLVVSGDLTCSLARVQIFTLGVRMVQFRATVMLNGKVAGCFIWGRFVGATAVVRGWRKVSCHCLWVCVRVRALKVAVEMSSVIACFCFFLRCGILCSVLALPGWVVSRRSRWSVDNTVARCFLVNGAAWDTFQEGILIHRNNIFLDTFPKMKNYQ